jgi:DNA polymerase II large subunit
LGSDQGNRSNDAIERTLKQLSNSPIRDYYSEITNSYEKARDYCNTIKGRGYDIDSAQQSQEVCDKADRLEALTQIKGIAEMLREYESSSSPAETALKLSEDIALGHFGFFEKEQILNLAMKASLVVVTSYVSAIPAEDITKVIIKQNGDGTLYASVVFGQISGIMSPFQAAFLLLVIDKIRITVGLDKYHVNSTGEDEVARFIEEVNTYEREVGPFRLHINDNHIRQVLQNLPVEVDGLGTEESEVLINRGLSRVKVDRLRGGALHVLIEGIIGNSDRLYALSRELQLREWAWLPSLDPIERLKRPDDRQSYILNAKPGKPVLSLPDRQGSFRLRYGRAQNTGDGCYGFHPAVLELLDFPMTTGTQIKLSITNRIGSVAVVDSLEPPIVELENGDVYRVENTDQARSLKSQTKSIIHLGDILVSPNEFSYSGCKLEPSGYVEEWWSSDLQKGIEDRHLDLQQLSTLSAIDINRLQAMPTNPLSFRPTLAESIQLCDTIGIPLHPRYLYYWDAVTLKDIFTLREGIVDYRDSETEACSLTFMHSKQIKHILETAGIPHKLSSASLIVAGDDARATYLSLAPEKTIPLGATYSDTLTLLRFLSGLELKRKSSTFVGVAMRRAEIATERKMRPPVHVLFPVGTKTGQSRDLLQFSHSPSTVEIRMMVCPSCDSRSPYESCPFCESRTSQLFYCATCRKESHNEVCPDCGSATSAYVTAVPRTQDLLHAASTNLSLQPYPPLKGVIRLSNHLLMPERLEKGILRQRHSLTGFKDGTIRYDVVNAPLTHFKPSQFHIDVKTLRDLGYTTDRFGQPLKSEEQIVELKPQDLILPEDSADHLKRLATFIDDLLSRFAKAEAYYNIQKQEDLLGTLIVGISPKASIGVVGRIIGFANARVCYAHPIWHASKHRNCGGEVDSVTLLLDVMLNYSPRLCPDQLGGLLDVPFMIEPIVLLSTAPRRTPFNALSSYSSEFYDKVNSKQLSPHLEEPVSGPHGREETLPGPSYDYTHWSSVVVASQPRSQYVTTGPMPEKVSRQISVANRIRAVDVDGLVSSLLNNYLVREILANLDAYSTQKFRCKGCGETYRRPPLKGTCLTCGRELLPTVTLAAVEKYALLASELAKSHEITQPIKDKVALTLENLQLLSESKKQTSIADYV